MMQPFDAMFWRTLSQGLTSPVVAVEPVPDEQSHAHSPARQNRFKALDQPQGYIGWAVEAVGVMMCRSIKSLTVG